jgi:hypothetical protein
VALLKLPQVQLGLLGGLVMAIVLAIVLTDVATGGETETPSPLGADIVVTPGSGVVIVPTLAPIEGPTAESAVATREPSNEADALIRDALRVQDLDALQTALAEYRDRFGEYPNTGGGMQTMCAYQDIDKGCDLKEVLSESEEDVLIDPLGDPLANGYWYVSDGASYTIWTLREGPGNAGDPVCTEVPAQLVQKGSLFCVTVGASSP